VAILLKKSIFHSYNINKLNIKVPHIESLFLQLREGNTTVTLDCVYRPPDTSQENDIKLIDQLRNLSMVHGDFNFSTIHWPVKDSLSGNNSASHFTNLLLSSTLEQLITEPTRFRSGNCPSLLDLLLTNNKNMISCIYIRSPIGKSDHVVIEFKLQTYALKQPRHTYHEISIVDQQKLKQYLMTTDWLPVYNTQDATKAWNLFHKLLSVATAHVTRKKQIKINREKPWISHNFFTRLKLKRKLWLKFKRSYSESDYLVHRKYSNKLSHDLKKVKNNYENKLLEKDTKAVYKYINSKISSRVSTPRVIKDDGSLCNNNLETANTLAIFFESVYVKESLLNFPSILIPNIVDSLDEIELNDSLLLEELSNINLTSAPGPDNISGSTLRLLHSNKTFGRGVVQVAEVFRILGSVKHCSRYPLETRQS
jgi:hypothetical protein